MAKKAQYSSCEIPVAAVKKNVNRNRLYPFKDDFRWKGVKTEKYKTEGDDWAGIARQVLVGASGENTRFHLRYFEIKPGGYSSFESHKHEHVVVGIRGKGKAKLNRRTVDVNFLDVLYVKPDTPHRLYNPYSEPFGFFCIVDSKRDRPVPVK
jgi:ribulose-bisphosphate carboxylase large chain